ncbi:hypothetical protein [Sphingomonas sp. Y38-1Y]|uniref:hypothetical protein n=1 Tax=Sphingomonas sp. Y38-1Y TaxID=3078265 RepID=UPI0028E272DB|nr:hypothetical protein [Sphingomonas sp. Y38-1Y]
MLARRSVLGALLWPMLGGCGKAGDAAQRRMEKPMTVAKEFQGLSVRVALAVEADALVLSYEARATGSEAIFLLDGIHDPAAGGKLPMRNRPWVFVGEGEAVLTARFHAAPPGMFVNALNVPVPTRIAPGERIERRVTASLPLVGDEPYRKFERPPVPQRRELPVFFELGWFVGRPGVEAMAKSVETSEGPRMAFPSVSEEGQQVGRFGPLGSVPVIANALRA